MTTASNLLTESQKRDLFLAAPEGRRGVLRSEYRGKGNWAIYVCDEYQFTYWTG